MAFICEKLVDLPWTHSYISRIRIDEIHYIRTGGNRVGLLDRGSERAESLALAHSMIPSFCRGLR